MGLIGVNLMDGNYFGGESYFEDILRITPGTRQSDPWAPDSGSLGFDTAGRLVDVGNHSAVIRLNMTDAHDPGTYQVTDGVYPSEQFKFVDANGKQAGSSKFVKQDGVDGELTINVKVGDTPYFFHCSRVGGSDGHWRDGLIDSLKPFSVLRVMDLQRMNHPYGGNPKPAHLSTFQGHDSYGMHPVEIADLCKLSDSIPWICIHADWSLDYVREYLDYFADCPAYVECGNENWNGGGGGSRYHGRKWNGDRVKALEYFLPYYRVAKEVDRNFTLVIPTQDAGAEGQLGNTKKMIDFLDSRDELGMFDVLAGKAYFGGGNTAYTINAADNVGVLRREMEYVFERLDFMGEYAESLGLEHGVYECGQGMDHEMAIETNRHPDMEQLYFDFVQYLQSTTDVACLYAHTYRPRSKMREHWGLKEFGTQTSSPKLDGVLRAIEVQTVPVPPTPAPGLTMEQIIAEFDRRFPKTMAIARAIEK